MRIYKIGKTWAKRIVADYTYDLYGSTTADANVTNPFQYTGRENDGTGLYYYRARYYSPTQQRFISQDPMGLRAGMNVYAYVGGNPVSFRDPIGKCPWCIGAVGGAIVGGIYSGWDNNWDTTAIISGAVGGAVVGGSLGVASAAGVGAGGLAWLGGGLSGVANLAGQAQNIGSPEYQGINVGSLVGAIIGGAIGGGFGGLAGEGIAKFLGSGAGAKLGSEMLGDAITGWMDPLLGHTTEAPKGGEACK